MIQTVSHCTQKKRPGKSDGASDAKKKRKLQPAESEQTKEGPLHAQAATASEAGEAMPSEGTQVTVSSGSEGEESESGSDSASG